MKVCGWEVGGVEVTYCKYDGWSVRQGPQRAPTDELTEVRCLMRKKRCEKKQRRPSLEVGFPRWYMYMSRHGRLWETCA